LARCLHNSVNRQRGIMNVPR